MTIDQAFNSFRFDRCFEIPTPIELGPRSAPWRTVREQVIAFDDHRPVPLFDRQLADDGLLVFAVKHRRPHDRLGVIGDPSKQVSEPVGVEGIFRTLALGPPESRQTCVGQMERIHRKDHTRRVTEMGAQRRSKRRLPGPRGTNHPNQDSLLPIASTHTADLSVGKRKEFVESRNGERWSHRSSVLQLPVRRGVTRPGRDAPMLALVLAVSHQVVVAARIIAAILGAMLAFGTMLSAIETVVVPRATSQRITRVLFFSVRTAFEAVAHPGRAFPDRDRILSVYAPLSFVLLPLVWVVLTVIGFTGVQWGISGGSLRQAFLLSGSSMLTLGVAFRKDLPSATFSFLQASMGLILVALLISYLPTIYGAFARRETLVGRLEARAGIPPSPYELLVRYQRIGALEILDDDLFDVWEQWFVEVEESHSSFVALAFFRSPRPERSWITAAGCVLDTCALYLSVLDVPRSPKAALCLRTGFISLGRLASYFSLPLPDNPTIADPISVTRREFDLMIFELRAAGLPIRNNLDDAWTDFLGWRVNYDAALVGLTKLVIAPDGRWSSDRAGDRYVPTIRRNKNGLPAARVHRGGRFR